MVWWSGSPCAGEGGVFRAAALAGCGRAAPAVVRAERAEGIFTHRYGSVVVVRRGCGETRSGAPGLSAKHENRWCRYSFDIGVRRSRNRLTTNGLR